MSIEETTPADQGAVLGVGEPEQPETIEDRFLAGQLTLDEAVVELLAEWESLRGTQKTNATNLKAAAENRRARAHFRRLLMRMYRLHHAATTTAATSRGQAERITRLEADKRDAAARIRELEAKLAAANEAAEALRPLVARALATSMQLAATAGTAGTDVEVSETAAGFTLNHNRVVIALWEPDPSDDDEDPDDSEETDEEFLPFDLRGPGIHWEYDLAPDGFLPADYRSIRERLGHKGELIVDCPRLCGWADCDHRRKLRASLLEGPSGVDIEEKLKAGFDVHVMMGAYLLGPVQDALDFLGRGYDARNL